MSLHRSNDERVFFGVCAGLADALRVPPLAMRIAFVLLGLTWGLGVVAYLLLALLMDEEDAGDDERELEERMAENGREALARVRELGRDIGDGARGVFNEGERRGPKQRKFGITLLILGVVIVLWSLGLLSWVTVPILIGGAAAGYGGWLLFGNREGPPEP